MGCPVWVRILEGDTDQRRAMGRGRDASWLSSAVSKGSLICSGYLNGSSVTAQPLAAR